MDISDILLAVKGHRGGVRALAGATKIPQKTLRKFLEMGTQLPTAQMLVIRRALGLAADPPASPAPSSGFTPPTSPAVPKVLGRESPSGKPRGGGSAERPMLVLEVTNGLVASAWLAGCTTKLKSWSVDLTTAGGDHLSLSSK